MFALSGAGDSSGKPNIGSRSTRTSSCETAPRQPIAPNAPGTLTTAEILEEAGDREQAAMLYADVLAMWNDADPELQSRVEAVRVALARVSAEPAR